MALKPEKNEVVLGFEDQSVKHSLIAKNLVWSSGETPAGPFTAMAKIRSSQQPTPVEVEVLPDGSAKIEFENLQKAVAPGQSVVLYDNDLILGGGVIDSAE